MNRKVDSLGRLVLPVEWRKQNGLQDGGIVSISAEATHSLIIHSTMEVCIFCGTSTPPFTSFLHQPICASCLKQLVASSQ